MYELRPYQRLAVEDALKWLQSASAGDRRLYAAPTGTGKSIIELAVQAAVPGAWIVTPRIEIVAGLLEKLGIDTFGYTESGLICHAWEKCITTPIRLRNAMLAGRGPDVSALIIDESHHAIATTYKQLDLLAGKCPALGYTATPYRGTPRGTSEFLKQWGEPVWILTYPEAVKLGVLSFPTCKIVPLVDDDLITVTNGEFETESINAVTTSRLQDAAELCKHYSDRSTMASLPSVETAITFGELLSHNNVTNYVITGGSSQEDRQTAFRACVDSRAILVQINVVSEGIDLPIRRLLDLSPSISPVKWLQQLGRITRPVKPGELPPEYICTNRNLLRHAYLLEGCLPPSVIVDAQKCFPTNARAGQRVIGLEALGRLKAIELPLKDGSKGLCYHLSSVNGATVTEYACLCHPLKAEPIWASRYHAIAPNGTKAYGRWVKCAPPNDLTGFASLPPSPMSDKQSAWWSRCAGKYGLDPAAKVTRKNFSALPVLADLNTRI